MPFFGKKPNQLSPVTICVITSSAFNLLFLSSRYAIEVFNAFDDICGSNNDSVSNQSIWFRYIGG